MTLLTFFCVFLKMSGCLVLIVASLSVFGALFVGVCFTLLDAMAHARRPNDNL